MMFQLVLSQKLRDHLMAVGTSGSGAPAPDQQLVVHDAATKRMSQIPGYSRTARADNLSIFHGREVRKVAGAAGSMEFVLQLSHAAEDDPEGWTPQERAGYDGWGHDSKRVWRDGERLEREGFERFRHQFGAKAFTLHHRFYLHLDQRNRLWLAAEDGCEGFPSRRSSIMGPNGPGT